MKTHYKLPIHNPIQSNLLGILRNPGNQWADLAFSLILLSSVICFLTVKGWTNTCLFVLLIPSTLYFKKYCEHASKNCQLKLLIPICIGLSTPIIAIFISQWGRHDWLIRAYDGPSRMFFSIPILLFLTYKNINFTRLIFLASPLALFITFCSIHLHPELYWSNRFATNFVDPNTLGIYSVIFASFCLMQLTPSLAHKKEWFIYQSLGVVIGLHLAIGSGTRGSLLAIPIIFIIWLVTNYHNLTSKFTSLIFFAFTLSIFLLLYFSPDIVERFNILHTSFISWLDHSNVNTSIGLRLSMWKISWQLFLHDPFFGYGEKGFVSLLKEPWLKSEVSKEALYFLEHFGTHNEFFANALKSGVFGIISYFCLLITPFTIFIKNIAHHNYETSMAAKLGLVFITCLAISSIGLEIFNLKYTATFYGLIIAGLVAQICSVQPDNKNPNETF